MADDAPHQRLPDDPGENWARGRAPRVALVAEDEPSVRDLIATLLTVEGWEVHTTASGAPVPDLVDAHRPVLVLLDVMMPGGDGIDAMARTRDRGHGSDVDGDGTVIILLTALGDADDVQRGVLAGADDYITKPFDVTDLADRAERWCRAVGWELDAPPRPGEVHYHAAGAVDGFDPGGA